ncbi:4-carboxymuconolactone decarboxylase [Lachnospiraceae bacterium KM106-2]|nr:4-carboxymuconolactone decarboxylase [Lachnospiraceae bacterium KM106-2]
MTNFTEEQRKNDPEFTELFDQFAFDEVANANDIDEKTRYTVILATLLGCQGVDEFKRILPLALDGGVTPIEAKEIIYQATAYLGIGRTYPFLDAANEVMAAQGIPLPLKAQGTTTKENRREKGTNAQIDLFGPQMADFWKASDMNRFLAGNCFGDYYTRGGLNYSQRELVTFCYIAAQGGCEPQLMAHTMANFMQGNDKNFLIKVVSQMVPYIGYPRSLNAIGVVNQMEEKRLQQNK